MKVKAIENSTRTQPKASSWTEQRKGQITLLKFEDAHTKIETVLINRGNHSPKNTRWQILFMVPHPFHISLQSIGA